METITQYTFSKFLNKLVVVKSEYMCEIEVNLVK